MDHTGLRRREPKAFTLSEFQQGRRRLLHLLGVIASTIYDAIRVEDFQPRAFPDKDPQEDDGKTQTKAEAEDTSSSAVTTSLKSPTT
jgi:hypothetical protein